MSLWLPVLVSRHRAVYWGLLNELQIKGTKEYENAISGVRTTAFGSMNGTTLLPTDKDPSIEMARQIKQSMKLDEISKEG